MGKPIAPIPFGGCGKEKLTTLVRSKKTNVTILENLSYFGCSEQPASTFVFPSELCLHVLFQFSSSSEEGRAPSSQCRKGPSPNYRLFLNIYFLNNV